MESFDRLKEKIGRRPLGHLLLPLPVCSLMPEIPTGYTRRPGDHPVHPAEKKRASPQKQDQIT
jgi:hypothetical protein